MSGPPFLRSATDHPFSRFVKFTTSESTPRTVYINLDHVLSIREEQGRTRIVHSATDRVGDHLSTYVQGAPESIITNEILAPYIDTEEFTSARDEAFNAKYAPHASAGACR